MEPPTDAIKYVRPVYTSVPTSIDIDINRDTYQKIIDACSVPKDLLYTPSEPEPVKEKLSWKQQQRILKKNPLWKG